jgi:hypothetical protein
VGLILSVLLCRESGRGVAQDDGGVCACGDLERSTAPDPMDLRDAMYT